MLPASNAAADVGDWYVTPAMVYTDDDGDRKLDDSIAGAQVSVGRLLTDSIALEGMLGYSDIAGYPGQEHLDISLNGVAYLMPDRKFSPFILAGIGYLGTTTTTGSDENRPSAALGLGFKWDLGDSRFAIRAEYKARLAWERNYNFLDRITTLGVQYTFGRRQPPSFDSDGDGVMDVSDQCPDTTPGARIDNVGCEFDEDGDGVHDSHDLCLATLPGLAVDAFGCVIDADGDGVDNSYDQCPRTVPGAEVDAFGCELDDDGDTVVNRLDKCPGTRSGARVDINGCEIQEIIDLPGVNFETNSDILLAGTEQVLREVVLTLRRNPDLIVEVAGHTDSDGAAESNLGLSERRAKTVRDFLISSGVSSKNLSVRGYGETQPIADNSTAEGRARNRRVELRISNR
jgi:OOP family OmpA-OmpF porin